jgi:hypothetical protein
MDLLVAEEQEYADEMSQRYRHLTED